MGRRPAAGARDRRRLRGGRPPGRLARPRGRQRRRLLAGERAPARPAAALAGPRPGPDGRRLRRRQAGGQPRPRRRPRGLARVRRSQPARGGGRVRPAAAPGRPAGPAREPARARGLPARRRPARPGGSATLGAALVHGASAAPFWAVWRTWWTGDAVGMVLVTPLVAGCDGGEVRRLLAGRGPPLRPAQGAAGPPPPSPRVLPGILPGQFRPPR